MGNIWITDMTDLPDLRDPDVDIPNAARRLTEYIGSIIEAATAQPPMEVQDTKLRCRRRPRRKPCPGHIFLFFDDKRGEIEWECNYCADRGVISGFEGTYWDKRVIQLFK